MGKLRFPKAEILEPRGAREKQSDDGALFTYGKVVVI